MNKIIQEQSQPQILKICYGNDFSLNVSVNIWDADTSAWSKLDLSAASDVELFLVSQNGKRIKTTSSIEQDGSLVAQIPSTYLSKTLYSIEITFRMDGRNRRTYSPCMIQIVNSTDEAGASVLDYVTNDAYHFDIMIKNDVAWLNIGSLPKEYVTEEELGNVLVSYVKTEVLDSTLDNYATNSSVETQISNLWNDANDTFVDNDELATSLGNYVESSHLYDNIYTKGQVDNKNAIERNYVNNNFYNMTQVNNMLAGYVNDAEYDSTNHNILLKNGSNTIATIDASPFIVDGMVDNVEIVNGNLVISFNTDAGKQDISIPISQIFDASNYYTSSQIDTMLSSYATTDYVDEAVSQIDLSSYVTTDDLSSAGYVTSTELTNAGYVTESYVSSYVDSLDSRVTYLEEHQGGDVDLSAYVAYVDWDNSNEAVAYELLNNRLDHQRFNNNYYTKTEADSRYASTSWADSRFVTLTGDVNRQQAIAYAISYLNDNIGQGGGTPDLSAYVTTNTVQTITSRKTFSDEVTFNSADQSMSFVDNANGIRKTGKMARGAFNQAVIGQIWAPSTAASDNTWNCTNQVNTIKFQYVDANSSDIKNPTLHQLAKIDTTGIYEGTTLLANKYVQSSYIRNIVQISQSDYDLLTPDSNTLYIIL